MAIFLLLLKQNIIMLVYMMIGFFLFKKQLVGLKGSADMGRLLLYVILPVAIVKSYIADFSMEMLEGLVISFIMALLCLILAMIVSRFLFRGDDKGVQRFGTTFSNAGFIGIPLVQMAIGEDAVFYVASFVALVSILQWTFGLVTMTGDKSIISLKKLRTNPIVISFIAGIALFFIPVTLPDAAMSVLSAISNMNGPIAMIILGTYLAQLPLREIFTDKSAYLATFGRLILIPVLSIVLLMFFPARYETIKLTVLIAAAAPIGANVAIFAQLYDKNYTQAVKEVCISTVLSIITLPVIVGIAETIL